MNAEPVPAFQDAWWGITGCRRTAEMTDCFTKEKRSLIMSRVGHFDTPIELTVRRALHRKGYRFRLHRRELPGNPDIVLPRYKKIIFVHGCFWHGHRGCRKGRHRPTSHTKFWNRRIEGNASRDQMSARKLRSIGWDVLVLWECQVSRPVTLDRLLSRFLERE